MSCVADLAVQERNGDDTVQQGPRFYPEVGARQGKGHSRHHIRVRPARQRPGEFKFASIKR